MARRLVASLDGERVLSLRHAGADLTLAAEHVLYTALRDPQPPATPWTARALLLGTGRPLRALWQARARPRLRETPVVALVTREVHATLFASVANALVDRGFPRPMVVTANTARRRDPGLSSADVDLSSMLPPGSLSPLVAYGAATAFILRRAPSGWLELVGPDDATRLTNVLRFALPRLALDVERLRGLLDAAHPRVVACFSESGLLARLAPTAAATIANRPLVVDMPHAEAADPWGTAGSGYDEVAVYGPEARSVMLEAGIPDERITIIGPLAADRLAARAASAPAVEPRRVLYASQPVKAERRMLQADAKRRAIEAAMALAGALRPAELVVVPHPTEPVADLRVLVAGVSPKGGVRARVEEDRRLHEMLPGSWVLVTISSQSVFEAVLSGVPAVTVNTTDEPDHVSFARNGIAIASGSAAEAAMIGARLSDADERARVVEAARRALGDRIGPIDGQAADRAATWLERLALESARAR